MKRHNDIIDKGKAKHTPARLKSIWLEGDGNGFNKVIIPVKSAPKSRLKAIVTAMPMKHVKTELIAGDDYVKLTRAEKKAMVKKRKAENRALVVAAQESTRKKAEVTPIKESQATVTVPKVKEKGVTHCNPEQVKPATLGKKARRKAAKLAKLERKAQVLEETESPPTIKEEAKVTAPVTLVKSEVTQCNTDNQVKLTRRQKKALRKEEAKSMSKLASIVEADETAASGERAATGPPQQEPKVVDEPANSSAWMPPVSKPEAKSDSVKHTRPKLVDVSAKKQGKITSFGKSKPDSAKKQRGYTHLARGKPVIDAVKPAANTTEQVKTTVADNVAINTELYGTCIRDTGYGRTPSGLPISDFLVGGKYPPPSKLHSVTSSNSDYTYEELGQLLDIANTELHTVKVDLANRISRFNDQYANMGKVIVDQRSKLALAGFSDANSFPPSIPAAVTELQDLNTVLTEDNDALREEVGKLSDFIEQLERHTVTGTAVKDHHLQSDGTFKQVSATSKPTMKTLGLQYGIFASNFRDDPVRCFLKHTGYPLANVKPLKAFFDDEFDARAKAHTLRQYENGGKQAEEEIAEHQKTQRLHTVTSEVKIDKTCMSAPLPLPPTKAELDTEVYKSWGNRTTTPMCAKRINYAQWWMDNLTEEDARLRSLRQTFTARKIAKPLKTFSTKVKKVMDAELNPFKIKANRLSRKKKAAARRANIKKEELKMSNNAAALTHSKAVKKKQEAMAGKPIPTKRERIIEHDVSKSRAAIKASSIKRQREGAIEKEIASEPSSSIKDSAVNLGRRGFIITESQHPWKNKA